MKEKQEIKDVALALAQAGFDKKVQTLPFWIWKVYPA